MATPKSDRMLPTSADGGAPVENSNDGGDPDDIEDTPEDDPDDDEGEDEDDFQLLWGCAVAEGVLDGPGCCCGCCGCCCSCCGCCCCCCPDPDPVIPVLSPYSTLKSDPNGRRSVMLSRSWRQLPPSSSLGGGVIWLGFTWAPPNGWTQSQNDLPLDYRKRQHFMVCKINFIGRHDSPYQISGSIKIQLDFVAK